MIREKSLPDKWVVRDSNPRPGDKIQRDPTLFPTMTFTVFEVVLLIPAPVGVAAAVKFT